MSTTPHPEALQGPRQLIDDEIDLRQVAAALVRQKVLIGGITIAAALLSGLYAFTRKPVWEGSFQIVLENKSSDSGSRLAQLAAANPMLADLAGLAGDVSKSSLETEVKILESPSVLKPVYDFVKTRKAAGGVDVSGWVYTDWLSNLSIELIKGTSILNLDYQDTDESLVLPVLEMITKTYQEYSNRDNANSINNGLRFAGEQSQILRAKAKDSNRKLDAFKFTYGINDAADSINLPQLDKLSSPLPQISQGRDPLSELAAINKELTRRRQFLKEADPSVQRLQKERQAILQYIDQTAGGLISIAGGGSKELNREILLEYKELQRTAMRDNAALTAMESELLSLQIQKAQERPPWELISTPTVLDDPVAPRKKFILALGLLAGLGIGCVAALVRDRISGLVFSVDELKSLMPCPLIKHLPAGGRSAWLDAADLLAKGPLAQSPGERAIALIPIGSIPNEQLQAFSAELKRALEGRELLVSTDLRQTSRCATQLLLTSQGVSTRIQLSQLRQKLALQGTPLAGWVLLDPGLNLG